MMGSVRLHAVGRGDKLHSSRANFGLQKYCSPGATFPMPCYLTGNRCLPLPAVHITMTGRRFNRNKLHAALCMALSAVVSIAVIVKLVDWLF